MSVVIIFQIFCPGRLMNQNKEIQRGRSCRRRLFENEKSSGQEIYGVKMWDIISKKR